MVFVFWLANEKYQNVWAQSSWRLTQCHTVNGGAWPQVPVTFPWWHVTRAEGKRGSVNLITQLSGYSCPSPEDPG